MRIHLYQNDIEWEDPERNISAVNEILGDCIISSGDLVILPEMFSTGFSMRPELSNEIDKKSPTINFLERLASKYSCCVIAGITTKRNDQFFNEAFAVLPNKKMIFYKKNHLFPLANEHNTYEAGCDLTVFEWSSWVIGMSICYDLRFPELYRGLAKEKANLMINIANWPIDRIEHWITLLRARAIENQTYVAGVNRTGSDPNSTYNGRSMIIDPMGNIINDAGEHPGVHSSVIDLDQVNSWRSNFPALEDMMSKKYN